MKKFFILIFLQSTLFLSANALPQIQYFPKEKVSNFRANWYGKQLSALNEPSLYMQKDSKKSIYRFLWLRTFHNPVAIRLEILKDKSAFLYIKRADGAGGYKPGKLILNRSKKISKKEFEDFLKLIKKERFWYLSTNINIAGCDGSQWIIEGEKDGKYHIVDRWSPEKGHIRKIGLMFLKLSGLKIDKEALY